MKLPKLVWYDLRHKLFHRPIHWLLIVPLFALLFLIFSLDILHYWWFDPVVGRDLKNINAIGLSFGDVLITQMGGILPIVFTTLEDSFEFPIKWLAPHILVLYFTLNYVTEDLTHCGIQTLTRAKSKRVWWYSKCIWNGATVVSCFFIGFLTLYLLSAITGKGTDFTLNPSVFKSYEGEYLPEQTATALEYFCALCVMPCVVCITVSIMQMALSLFVRPAFAYIASCAYYIAGAYYAHPLLISNYAMPIRSATIGFYNFYFRSGMLICLAMSGIALVCGAVRMEKMDLINNAG